MLWHYGFLGKSSVGNNAKDVVTFFEMPDSFADRLHYPSYVTTRRKRQRRFKLIAPLYDQGIREVDPAGLYP